MQLISMLGVVAAVILGANSAAAALFSWNTTGSLEPGAGTAAANGCAGGVECKVTFTSGGQTLTAKAYSTYNVYTSGSTNNVNGNWIEAQIALYSGGIGIKNLRAGDLGEGTQPEHSVDNDQIHDIVVFELPNGVWDPEAFKLGWIQGDSDVQAWIGGSNLGANYDFRNVCFQNCATGNALTSAALGFSEITSITGGGTNVPLNTSTGFNTSQTGRYLVMSGNLGTGSVTGFNDMFKISSISASTVKVPLPGSMLLLGLGLGVLTLVRVRTSARAA